MSPGDEALDQLIARHGPLPPDALRQLAVRLVTALAPLHATGSAHGGCIPSRILMTPAGPQLAPPTVLVTGIAPADDIHALGTVLHFAATGLPHTAPHPPEIPDPALRALVLDCLAPHPAARPTAPQLLQRLGQPAAPPPPPYPPTPPPGSRIRGWRGPTALLAGVLAAILGLALGLTYWSTDSAGSSDGSAPSGATRPGGAPNHRTGGFTWSLTKADTGSYVGLWSTPSSVVLGTNSGLTAYNAATGRQLWSWRPPDNGILCNMSHNAPTGVGAFSYGSFVSNPGIEKCDHLQTISLASGKPGWAQPVSLVGSGSTGFPDLTGGASLSIGDGVVTAAFAGPKAREHGSGGLLVADARTGRVRWSADADGTALPGGCQLSGHAQAVLNKVYALANCGSQTTLFSFPGDIDAPAAHSLGSLSDCQGPINTKTISGMMTANATHLLVGCGPPDPGGRLFTVSAATGELRRLDTTGVATGSVASLYGGAYAPVNVLMGGDTLYLPKGRDSTDADHNDGVVAIDLNTGHQRWSSSLPEASSVTLLAPTPSGASGTSGASGASGVEVLAGSADQRFRYTITGPRQAVKGPALTADQAKFFASAGAADGLLAVRAGDYLAVGFPGSHRPDQPVLGVLPPAARHD
ncbi:PQQ-binding-like beta-propeller repeat protein [Streptomyces orinoci]|uniref:PQQ-binding-like beta-propeller repeat protein n=1 Tax=Streptomyces orinoci TaxID=67339 RepID=A0ABV3K677_STRON|nr:PQQ-binding-like beta-propeller repeat protein [Streptomyces orinoci]